jgi:hypothetical protein
MIRTPGGYGPQPQIRSGFQGPASGGGGGRSLMQGITGGRELRYNRLLDKMGSPSILFKVPQEWGTDENNVVLGLSQLSLAFGASGTAQVNVPRDLILRRLILVNNALATDVNFVVTAITIEGNSVLLGNGIAGSVFGPNSYWSPAFDLPVAGGTPVTISITNANGAGTQVFTPCFTID